MSLITLATFNTLRRSWLFMLAIALVILLFGIKLTQVHAQDISISSPRNCDANAVVYCGAGSVDDLINKYENGDGHNTSASIRNIYGYFGISAGELEGMNGMDVESGSVTSSGDVYVGSGQLVATSALTAGRENIAGSTAESIGGTTFYVRPPRVSFASSRLSAFVVMVNGRFDFAVLASCGNPVKATPVAPKPTPPPAPKPVTPKPVTPAPATSVCSGNTTNVANGSNASQGGNCSSNTTVVQNQTPPPTQSTQTTAPQCTGLQISVDQNNPLAVTATAATNLDNQAVVQNVVFNFGDGTATSTSTSLSQTHTYQQAGTYTISATINFAGTSTTSNVNASVQSGANASSGNSSASTSNNTNASSTSSQSPTSTLCQASITLASPATPAAPTTTSSTPTTTQAPSALVNTGPGEVIGLFSLTAVGSAFGYQWFVRRKLSA